MASSPLRQLLEERVSQMLADADRLAIDSRQRAVSDCAGRLNQSVRRIRQADTVGGLTATFADCSAGFASGAAVFEVDGPTAVLGSMRGLDQQLPARFEIPLTSAPALASAVETRDPVTAAAVPGELSPALVELIGHTPEARVSILPVAAGERVLGLLYTWGATETSALELLAQVAGGVWSSLKPVPVPTHNLVSIGAPSPSAAASAPPPRSWDSLPEGEQQIHLRAQRFARVRVSQIRLSDAEAVQSGRSGRDVYGSLRGPIDAARQAFRQRFFLPCPSMVDYLHLELVRTLAHDDAELLGPDYPGPLV